jgi:hypothetical protein
MKPEVCGNLEKWRKIMKLYKEISLLLAAILIFQTIGAAAPKTKPDVKKRDLKPELIQSAVKLLSAVGRETELFGLPENRIRARTIIADLMWKYDERAASELFQKAFVELQVLFEGIDEATAAAAAVEKMSGEEKSAHYSKLLTAADLRGEYILTLGARDPQAALAAFSALQTKPLEEYDPLRPNELELKLTAVIVNKDPNRAHALVKEQIAARGVNHQIIESLRDLHGKNSELAAKLGREMLAKIKTAKIRANSTGVVETTNSTAKSGQLEIEFWQAASFINTAWELNRKAERDKTKKTLPLLTEAEMRELADALARAFLTSPNPSLYTIGHAMAAITRYAPAQAQRIRQKVGAETARQFDQLIESSAYQFALKEKSPDELALDADRAAPEKRDGIYADAARKALDEEEPEKAESIALKIKNRKNYAYLFEQIEAALPLAKARRGDLIAVRKILASLRTEREKIETLIELAAAVNAKGDTESAKKLAEEALQIISSNLKKQTDLEMTAKALAVYSSLAPEMTFMMVEHSIGQMNNLIDAGIAIEDFYDYGAVESGELRFRAVNKQALLHVPNSTELLQNLAIADFERAVGLADKFRRQEIRLYFRLRVAQSLLDDGGGEKEKKARAEAEAEDEYH